MMLWITISIALLVTAAATLAVIWSRLNAERVRNRQLEDVIHQAFSTTFPTANYDGPERACSRLRDEACKSVQATKHTLSCINEMRKLTCKSGLSWPPGIEAVILRVMTRQRRPA